jgi:PspC domain
MRFCAERKIAGVCAGLAQYFDLDVSLMRILCFFITLATTPSAKFRSFNTACDLQCQKDAEKKAASLTYLPDVGLLHAQSSAMCGLFLQVQSWRTR